VPEGVAPDILGHEKKTLSYGLYSAVSSMQRKREAIEKLVYPGASLWPHARTGGRSVAAPKYATDEERRAARRQAFRKWRKAHREAEILRQVAYREANREAIKVQRDERRKKKREAMKAERVETDPPGGK
jgi:hypothetical protein